MGGFIIIFIFGWITQILYPNADLDLHFHDTYIVVAHFHLVAFVAIFFGLFACIYYLYPKLFGRRMSNTLGFIHFIITFFCVIAIFWPMHYEGFAGQPRRYYDYSAWESFKSFSSLNVYISFIVVCALFAQLLFVFNFFVSFLKRPF